MSDKLRFKDENGQDYPEWEKKKLGEVGYFKTSSIDKLIHDNEELVKMVNYMDVYKKVNLNIKTINTLSDTSAKENQISENSLMKGDILFTPSSETPDDIGHSVVIFENLPKTVYSYHLVRFRPTTNKLDTKYSHYFCNNTFVRSQIVANATGSTRFTVSLKDFTNISVQIPHLEEQQKIADFLSTVDEKIEVQKEIVKNLEEMKKGLIQKIFSQEIRFKDEGKNCDSLAKDVYLGELCNIVTGKLNANAMVSGGKYRFYTCAANYFFIDKFAFDTNALIISGNGANVGYIHHYHGKFNAYQRTYVLDNFNENINYIKYFLEKKLPLRIDEEKRDGSTPYITLNTLTDMLITIPSLKEQQKIADFLSTVDKKIELEKNILDEWIGLKKGLLQRIFA